MKHTKKFGTGVHTCVPVTVHHSFRKICIREKVRFAIWRIPQSYNEFAFIVKIPIDARRHSEAHIPARFSKLEYFTVKPFLARIAVQLLQEFRLRNTVLVSEFQKFVASNPAPHTTTLAYLFLRIVFKRWYKHHVLTISTYIYYWIESFIRRLIKSNILIFQEGILHFLYADRVFEMIAMQWCQVTRRTHLVIIPFLTKVIERYLALHFRHREQSQ